MNAGSAKLFINGKKVNLEKSLFYNSFKRIKNRNRKWWQFWKPEFIKPASRLVSVDLLNASEAIKEKSRTMKGSVKFTSIDNFTHVMNYLLYGKINFEKLKEYNGFLTEV